MTPETLSQIAILRQKAADNTLTREDMILAVRLLREDRRSAHTASDSSRRAKAKAEIKSADDMLDELGKI